MRSLSEIQQANKEFEDRDKAGDFDDDPEICPECVNEMPCDCNRCRACQELVEDCICNRELGGGTQQ